MKKYQIEGLFRCFDNGLYPHDIPSFAPAFNLGQAIQCYEKWLKNKIDKEKANVSFLKLEFVKETDECKECFFEKESNTCDCCGSEVMFQLTGKDCSDGYVFKTKKEIK